MTEAQTMHRRQSAPPGFWKTILVFLLLVPMLIAAMLPVPAYAQSAPPPSITSQPAGQTTEFGGTASFTIAADNARFYQWQVNTGSGFTSITNGGVYSGTESATLTITGATVGMNGYRYRALVTGNSSPSAISNAATLTVNPTVPGAPTGVSATAGFGAARVLFTPPASDGGAMITGYAVTASPGGATATGSASPITVTGLTSGTPYIFTVTATNSAGRGPASNPSNPATPVPPAPTFSSISPFSGPWSGGTVVTISGSNLTDASSVTIGGNPATDVSVINDSTITAITPAGAAGPADVEVPTPGGWATRSNAFVYQPPAPPVLQGIGAPLSRTYGIGTTITFYLNFSEGVEVTGTPVVPITVGSTVREAEYQSVSGSRRAIVTFSYVVQPGDLDTDGIVLGTRVDLNGGTIRSIATGADADLVVWPDHFIGTLVDGVAPDVTAITVAGTPAPNATTVTFDVVFSKPVTSVDVSDFVLSASGFLRGVMDSVSGSGAEYSVTVAGIAGSGTMQLEVALNASIIDLAGNRLVGGFANGEVWTIVSAPSNDATLSGLALSTGALVPAFASDTPGYSVTVPNGTDTIAVTPTATDAGATITVNGAAVASGSPSGSLALSVGENTVTVEVTAGDGTSQQVYTIVVTREGTLMLSPSAGRLPEATVGYAYSQTISASGGSGSYTYAITSGALPNGLSLDGATGEIQGMPTAISSPSISFTVTATDATSPTLRGSAAYILPVGSDIVLADGTVGVSYPAVRLSTDGSVTPLSGSLPPGLSVVHVSGVRYELRGVPEQAGTYSFAFSSGYRYTVSIHPSPAPTISGIVPPTGPASGGTQVVITGTNLQDATAVTFGGSSASFTVDSPTRITAVTPSGTAGAVEVAVTTPFGTADRPGGFIYIAALTLNPAAGPLMNGQVGSAYAGTFVASGGSGNYSYAVTDGTLPDGLTLAADGTLSGTPTTVQAARFTITASDVDVPASTGAAVYSIEIDSSLVSTNAKLASLRTSAGSLTPVFDADTFAYEISVTNEVETITLTPTAAEGHATIVLNGQPVASSTASQPIALAVGPNAVAIMVTAQDGTTTQTYRVTVTRAVLLRPDPSQDPEVIGLLNAQANTATRFAQTQVTNFQRRLEQLHHEGERRKSSMDIRLAIIQNTSSTSAADLEIERMLADRPGPKQGETGSQNQASGVMAYFPDGGSDSAGSMPSPLVQPDFDPLAVWTGGFVNFGTRESGSLDIDHTMVGLSGGIDYRFADQFTGGFGVGYGRDRTAIGTNGTESRATAFSAAAYGSYKPMENLFIDGLIGGSWMDFDSIRFVTASGDFALGSRSGSQLFGALTAAYEFRDEHWLISPYGRIEASRSWLDGFTEDGGGIYGLTYGDQTIDTLSGVIGIKASHSFQTEWGILTPGVRAEYTYDFAGSSHATMGYTDLGAPAYAIEIEPTVRDHLTLGLSLDVQFNDDVNLGFDYRTRFGGSGVQDHTFGAKLGVRF